MSFYNSIIELNLAYFSITKSIRLLDVGCGNGDEVNNLRSLGYEAYGIDVEFKEGIHRAGLEEAGIIKTITMSAEGRADLKAGDQYAWPFSDKLFDVIVSRAVIEHVQNLDEFIDSSKAALNPIGGLCLHYYPSKYAIVEPHTGVPFGGILMHEVWFRLMCALGVCFKSHRGKGKEALAYMRNYTAYRSQKEIDLSFRKAGFVKVEPLSVLACHPSRVFQLCSRLPLANFLFSIFRSKVVAYRRA